MMKSIAIEGIDRLGKSTLIQGLKNQLGFFQVIHYQKPEKLDCYHGDLFEYQRASFVSMLRLLSSNASLILDRAHLGEAVYAKRYRGYDGNYVFDLELEAQLYRPESFDQTTLLVLLYTSDFSFIKDDGLSFDFSKKEEEQADFIAAFDNSIIKHKIMVDVSNGKGGYRPASEILSEVVHAFQCDIGEHYDYDSGEHYDYDSY